MNPKIFAQLCADASKTLALKDTTALGLGQPISIHGVDVELMMKTSFPAGVQVILEVGAPEPKARLAVYEALLAQQMLWMGDLNGLFCYDASHDRVLFSVGMPTDDNTKGEQVGKAIQGFADLVLNWRNGLLKGMLDPEWLDRDALLDKAAHS
ncbi:hypothetical protein [Hydrogenophaga sp.]|uniref:hypothetical protein n=1 Tax=Hydrogenophaga sp. TaxID=1904254 RepID=UPI002730BB00|nr:hypothetical protein [Hydrogenophaga sp.]MDP2017702.1 hypothetical protein [Hydrogenophaga sp.]MDP3167594.1 hypothetical protein [Hydrogenophaga sp.]MDP3810824.1 hypothetical protein [Hydrogenophaga sp.]